MAVIVFTTYTSKEMANSDLLANLNVLSSEALALGESSGGSSGGLCYSGGRGSTSCSIDAGIEIIGVGIAGGCSVSCSGGYYSCCSLRCTCKKS